jgi:thymidylate synthase (FAD)
VTEIEFRSDFTVKLVNSTVEPDRMVVAAARVSTEGASSLDAEEHAGLIKFLMTNRHGSPFEHNQFTFFIQAPIFVWRELMRHRIASYNEESGRYKQLEPVFYVPGLGRPLVQTGKAGKYVFEAGSPWQHARVAASLKDVAEHAYDDYEDLLEHGVAREVARMCLPLNIYSSAYVTMNARGLMNFFSLRTKHEDSMFPSFPQYEIEKVALEMENLWAAEMPLTAKAFTAGRRVAP